jgi:hypothetical protein
MPVNSYSGRSNSARKKKLKIYGFETKIDFGMFLIVNTLES